MVLKPSTTTSTSTSSTAPLYPSPPSNRPRIVWHAFIGTGQSLATGTGAPLTTRTPPISSALKLHDSIGEYDITNYTSPSLSVVPLTEPFRQNGMGRYPNNVDGLTVHSSMARTLERLGWQDGDNVGEEEVKHLTVHSLVARGGAPMHEISKGGSGVEYLASMFEARALTRLAHEQGAEIVYEAVILTHGEADAIMCLGGDYGDQLIKLQRDYASDLMAITGQEREPILVLSQQNTSPPTRELHSDVMQAMWRAQERSGGMIVCAGPKYQYGYVDGIHLDTGGYERLGEIYGRAVHDSIVREKRFVPLRPKKAIKSAKQVVVSFEVPVPPLRWGDCLPWSHQQRHKAWRKGRGFEVRDEKGKELEIEGVMLDEERSEVRLNLVESVESMSLTVAYAMTQQGKSPLCTHPSFWLLAMRLRSLSRTKGGRCRWAFPNHCGLKSKMGNSLRADFWYSGDGFGPGFCGGSESGRIGHLCDSADDGFEEPIECEVQHGSHVLVAKMDWAFRAVYDIVEVSTVDHVCSCLMHLVSRPAPHGGGHAPSHQEHG